MPLDTIPERAISEDSEYTTNRKKYKSKYSNTKIKINRMKYS